MIKSVPASQIDPTLVRELVYRYPDAILLITNDGKIVESSTRAIDVLGYNPEELSWHAIETLIAERSRHAYIDYQQTLSTLQPADSGHWHEFWLRHADGSEFPVDIMMLPFQPPAERPSVVIIRGASGSPPSGPTGANDGSPPNTPHTDKIAYLKTIDHRVKNNLQLIHSLLNLKCRSVPDEATRLALEDIGARLRVMTLAHQQLHASGDLMHIPLLPYFKELLDHIRATSGYIPRKIDLETNVDALTLDLDTAIPLGLILFEVVSNSLKHAFPDHRAGIIRVVLRGVDDGFDLMVFDNGIGLPNDFDIRQLKTTGLELATRLAKQLGSVLQLRSGAGTCARILVSLV